jgi:Na+-driven multidrug efflux pump
LNKNNFNLTDMFWLGKVGSFAVAASGAVEMYLWFSSVMEAGTKAYLEKMV